MVALIFLFLNLVAWLFKPKSRLEAENAALRHQLTVLQRRIRGSRPVHEQRSPVLHPWCPSVLNAMMIIRPETPVESTDMPNEKVMTMCADQVRRPAESGLDLPL
jgi:hypothetical protein